MNITLNDGTILEAVNVFGGGRFHQNAQRDCLEFHFDTSHSIDELHATFMDSDKLRQITLTSPEGEPHIHTDYVLHVETKVETVVIAPETSQAPAVTAQRIKVVMGQQTFTEKTLEQLLVNQK